MLLGQRSDVPGILCASDLFLFPSNYEGLGIVAVEAQASGLFCLASTGVPAAADVGIGLFERMSLDESEDTWMAKTEELLATAKLGARADYSDRAFSTDYNIHKIAKMAEDFYSAV